MVAVKSTELYARKEKLSEINFVSITLLFGQNFVKRTELCFVLHRILQFRNYLHRPNIQANRLVDYFDYVILSVTNLKKHTFVCIRPI
jgi:hypothetical protein